MKRLIAGLLLVALGLVGCSSPVKVVSLSELSRNASSAPKATPPAENPATGGTRPVSAGPASTTSQFHPSAKALAYAKSLGGKSHEGETLYLIIGDSVETEGEAQRLLDAARPRFGDMQDYFILQRSDNFEGLRAGWWTLIEAHRTKPSAEDLQFAKRGYTDGYIKRVVVRTSDPIPVYDDQVPQ